MQEDVVHVLSTTRRTRRAARMTSVLGVTALALTAGGCSFGSDDPSEESGSESGSGSGGGEVALETHDSFAVPDELIAQFEEETGYELVITTPGDAGSLVNDLLLTAGSPSVDVVYGIDNAYASRAISGGVLAPYVPEGLPESAADLRVDEDLLTPIDFGDVCLNVDTDWFRENQMEAPVTLEDLATSGYADLTVVTDPNVSSPGMNFLLATIAEYGDEGFEDYWQGLLDDGLRVVDSWSDAYYVDFTASGGDRPIVLSYSSSPAATLTEDGSASTTAALTETCVRQVEYAGVVEGAANPEGAQAVVDWLLSDEVQAALPDSMYVYPVSDSVELPEAWAQFAPAATNPLEVSAEDIDANREDWLSRWSAVVSG
ncbi:MAG: thiamine ABC transporter substrate-binding protein [Actinomycetaceae bacterium]